MNNEQIIDYFINLFAARLAPLIIQEMGKIMDTGQVDMFFKLKETIEDCGLSVRATNCLKAANINNLYDLLKNTPKTIANYRNMGGKTIKEIKTFVHDMLLKYPALETIYPHWKIEL